MSTCDFTLSHYEEILGRIAESDYKVTFFNESFMNDKELILRHDVDLDLESAYRMAVMENKFNVRATYFVLLRSPFYNVFDQSDSDYIKSILNLGHQIGLHFDETYYGSNDKEMLINHADSEVQILKSQFNTEVYAVSFHRPSRFVLDSDIKLKNGLINTYSECFIKDFKYISDSRRMWKEGCLCKLFENAGVRCLPARVQALVHPEWWTDKGLNAQNTMEDFLIGRLKYLDSELGKNIRIYRKLYTD